GLRLRHLGGVGACRSGCGVGEAAYAQGWGATRVCATVLISPSRERDNGGRGSITFTAITHKLEQWRARLFLVFAVYCSLPFIAMARRVGMRIRGTASPPWLICDNRWNEAPASALGGCCAEACSAAGIPFSSPPRQISLISTSSNGSFVNSTKFFRMRPRLLLACGIGTSTAEALLTCACLIPATLRWRRTATQSHQRSENFWSPPRRSTPRRVTSRLLQEKRTWSLRH